MTGQQINRALAINYALDVAFAGNNPTLQLYLFRQRRWLEGRKRKLTLAILNVWVYNE